MTGLIDELKDNDVRVFHIKVWEWKAIMMFFLGVAFGEVLIVYVMPKIIPNASHETMIINALFFAFFCLLFPAGLRSFNMFVSK